MLLSVPAVVGIWAVSPNLALAAENNTVGGTTYTSEQDGGSFTSIGTTNQVKLIALKPSEVGFIVIDMSTKENKPIPGPTSR